MEGENQLKLIEKCFRNESADVVLCGLGEDEMLSHT